jgi:hypothetical protein
MLLKAAFPLIGIFVLTSKTAPYYTPSRLFATPLHEKGYISNPATKAKSVAFTEEGARKSQELFENLFAVKP